MVPFERALMSSYRPSNGLQSNFSSIFNCRVSGILPLLCFSTVSTPLFPTPLLVSSKFPHVPLGVGGWPLGYEERRCWANCSCN